jgi:hypothetical protein
VGDVPFPSLLDPVDDHPPATSINWPLPGLRVKPGEDGTIMVRGTATDDDAIKRVVVNGVEARNVEYGFHRWEAIIPVGNKDEMIDITAFAEDVSGNREQTPHLVRVRIAR